MRASTLTVSSFLFLVIKSNLDLIDLDKGDEGAERDQIRQERHKERQRASALARAGGDKK